MLFTDDFLYSSSLGMTRQGRALCNKAYTNIPVDFTINLILKKLFNYDADFVLKGIDKNNMSKLLK